MTISSSSAFQIGNSWIGNSCPTYFIADIAANHDGSLSRAQDLIKLAADSGANAAKFQNFKASTIVSDHGFRSLGDIASHQSSWGESVYSVYDKASISLEWTHHLHDTCKECGIEYFTSPYDLDILDYLEPFVSAWKIGSGDISWHELISNLTHRSKPVLLATGASSLSDVISAMKILEPRTSELVLMQCNTNYTGSLENFQFINLNVLKCYSKLFPETILGLSDHTPGHATVLGSVALGARVIEKHFTDDPSRSGPDHKFSMSPSAWTEMVTSTRQLENALGDGVKRVEENETNTYVVQRRAIRAAADLPAGTVLSSEHLVALRPCPPDGLPPFSISDLIGRSLHTSIPKGELVTFSSVNSSDV
ncbi:N-acetylneuraminate synthase family protein [Synechococcus sp. MU1617]|uniref:N-acetylneuraminate synthase family protein n=1 Tax=Synechococcus sp. MU1617 TaxID=2508346 RepID=UPI001CF86A6C|nr:N-acetylneuraminate synthase family protein [Synechococcus sp. MU1617]MCB4389471.1 N-acetylneuraminate synthase [Synechococcus sp. MU1617]